MDQYLAGLTTEQVNEKTRDIDECSTVEMLRLINEQDAKVPEAVQEEIPDIARAVDLIYGSLKNGGRLFYIGAGTSGRLGVLDSSECPPTYGTDPELVQAYIAGGDIALRTAVEGCEDDASQGEKLVKDCGIRAGDVVVGITASGGAAFVLSAVREAGRLGASTVGVVNNVNSRLSELCDVCITPVVGPEVVVGSTRMKAGTAQKLVLNMLTTCTMIKLGKVYGNLMVDLKASNKKLYDRAKRIICRATGTDPATAAKYLELSGRNTKLAIMMLKTGLDAETSRRELERCGGFLKTAVRSRGGRAD